MKLAICDSLLLFVKTFLLIFQGVPSGRVAVKAVVSQLLGWRSVWDYAIDFLTLEAKSGWSQLVLMDAFFS